MEASATKYKVLCFHGYRQNAAMFREKTGGFRKGFKKEFEFDFISAPHVIKSPEYENGDLSTDSEGPRGWWFSNPAGSFKSTEVTEIADGFDATVNYVRNYVKEKGPFDGLIGFSQGASMLHLLIAMNQKDNFLSSVRFVVLFSAFKSLSNIHSELTQRRIVGVPSFHVFGQTDEIVDGERSAELTLNFVDPQPVIVTHAGKHCVPPVNTFKKELQQFLSSIK